MNKKQKIIKIINSASYYNVLFLKKTLRLFLREFIKLKNLLKSLLNKFKARLKFSIKFKIEIMYIRRVSILLFIITVSLLAGFKFFLLEEAKGDLKKYVEIIELNIKNSPSVSEKLISDFAVQVGADISILESNKKIIYTTEQSKHKIDNDFKEGNPYLVKTVDNGETLLINKKFMLNNSTYYVQIIYSLQTEKYYTSVFMIILLALDIILISIIIKSSSMISKRIVRTIKKMTETVKYINVKRLDTRLNVNGSHDELRELAQTFNNMFDRIQDSYEKQNRFVSDASHELRTPIAVIQGYVNMLDRWGKNDEEVLQEGIVAIKDESQNMKELVEKLLFLARADKKTQKVEKKEFYIKELLEELVKETILIDEKHKIINKCDKRILIFADYKLLKQALRIFIDNSLKFTPEEGSVTVDAHIKDDMVVIIVEDTGSGICKEDIRHIFDRFYRADKSRNKDKGGTGLGLAIAKWIVTQHRGSLKVKSDVGIGTEISIFIPTK